MQKKILAVVVGGLLAAPAFADVTISGRFADGIALYERGGVPDSKEQRLSDQSSRIIFSGSEDLGGGLKAWFQLDSRFSADEGTRVNGATGDVAANGTGFATGNTGVGVAGDWGKVTLGRWDLHYNELNVIEPYRAGALPNYTGMGFMTEVTQFGVLGTTGARQLARGTRSDNVVMYETNPIAGGLTVRAAYSFNPNGVESVASLPDAKSDHATNLTVRYVTGPILAGVSLWNYDVEGTQAVAALEKEKATRAWAGYTLPFGLFVGFAYDQSKTDYVGIGEVKRTAMMLPINYTLGNHKFYLTYAKADDADLAGTTVDSSGANATTIGWDYAFSKRTSAGVYYSKLKNDDNADYNMFAVSVAGTAVGAATVGADPKIIYFGVAHNF